MADVSGRGLGKFAGLDQPPTLIARALPLAELSAMRVLWSDTGSGNPTRLDRNNGYLVCLQRRDLPAGPYWVDDRPMQRMPINSGQFLLLDLNEEHSSLQYGSVDCISIYSSRDALSRFQEEHGLPPVGQLRSPRGIAFEDDVIRNLGECLVPAFEWPETANQLFVDHVALALLAHLTGFYGEQPSVLRPFRGGLSPWQERRAKDILLTHIDGKVGLAELARECGLSRSHFARAFRTATGLPPHKWLLARRIELAQELLRNPKLSLKEIAIRCGFTDQSHFTRVFSKNMHASPGDWRRLRS
ncbi:AraC family transcriptional regulator [Microvirga pakistanensis]|uniref:AraC family transcriptional regulator n=1 Tax=Microvirga pakistanensis TaxID=1682650 RepID=UPI001FCE6AAF|nr:AraC family transcriptional regulator [Microvirga pakistanensis]